MFNSKSDKANSGYVKSIKYISTAASGYKDRSILRKSLFIIVKSAIKSSIELVFIPVLILYGVLLVAIIRIRLVFAGKHRSALHTNALKYIPEFIRQYPMHLYPVVAKSIEMAFIKDNIDKVLDKVKGGVVELAVGDGTMSNRIFRDGHGITAFDLNPYSLIHTKNYQHISKRIIADCLYPPIADGGASFIICNNLLHHITNKEYTVQNWAKSASFALFNENTNYWSSGWTRPYILKKIGLKAIAKEYARRLEEPITQSLWKEDELKLLIRKYYDVIEERSFMHEKVFFLSAVCSALMLCCGPPTPRLQKKILNTVLRPLTSFLTYQMATALMDYDAILPREKDTFISWLVKSKLVADGHLAEEVTLVCPNCRESLKVKRCGTCKTEFEEKDGMLFLLPNDLASEISYIPGGAEILGKEHL